MNPANLAKSAEITTGYVPRSFQVELHRSVKRFNVIICHRRWGKTVYALNHLIDRAARHTLPQGRFAYIAPTYAQAKRISWSYLKTYVANIPGVEINEAELRIDFTHNNSRIMLLSAENPASLKGIYLDGCVMDEYGDMNPIIWGEVIRPTLSDRLGWVMFIGTVKGTNHFWELYEKYRDDPQWFCTLQKASETNLIPKEELELARQTMSEEQYLQEFECDPRAGLIGAYFAKEIALAEKESRITDVPYDPIFPVDVYFDLGINDSTAIWFVQKIRFQNRIIDCYEESGLSIKEIVKDLSNKPYKYNEYVLPHDAKARDLSTGKTQVQNMFDLGCRKIKVVPRIGSKRESINAARMIFGKCWFDKVKCAKGLKALSNYQRQWNSKNGVFNDAPLHNWASHLSDAFQCFALGIREEYGDNDEEGRYNKREAIEAETDYSVFGGR